MAKADRETIRALLTDTVTLLCRNSLPFSKQLKVQGLLGITVDEADFYIIQIDEEYGDGGPPGIMERAMPPVARAPMCSIPAKRPKTTIAGRTPVRRVAQTVPRRMRGGMIATSPGSAMARQKVRQQLNFPSPQRGMHNPAAATAATPANAKQMFAMRSPQSSSRLSAPVTPIRTPPVSFAQSSRTPLSQQKPRKMMLMLEDGKKPSMEQPPPPLQRQMPTKPMPKVEKMELFSGGFGKMPPVKMERSHGDVICVESDEENSEAKRMPDLVPYSGGAQSAMQDTGEDDKTKALHAIMNQALNEARGVSSSLADSYQGDSYQGEGNYISSFQTASGMYNESVVKKMEPVSSSQLTESDMAYDTSELGSTQFVDDFNSGLDMKPFFDQNPLQMSWDASAPPQSMSSPSWHLPPSQSQTPTRSSSQSVGSPSWIKTENTQVPQKMVRLPGLLNI